MKAAAAMMEKRMLMVWMVGLKKVLEFVEVVLKSGG
jgi:hypothetical protein